MNPRIWFERGYWRVDPMPKPYHGPHKDLWLEAHRFVDRLNAPNGPRGRFSAPPTIPVSPKASNALAGPISTQWSTRMNTIRPDIPPLPPRMRHLPIDERGYPVPFFVAMINGKPDHRVADMAKFVRCLREGLCWVCGKPLGMFKTFAIGPMCAINRVTSECPSHLQCAQYAVRACPFMLHPKAHRRHSGLEEVETSVPGQLLERNPGVMLLWVTDRFKPTQVPNGILFKLGEPHELFCYSQGREATREEVDASIASGLPILQKLAEDEDRDDPSAGAVVEMTRMKMKADQILDEFLPRVEVQQ